ncbi:MAG: glycosyltransferase, partial [Candidatus Eiseniibacteriota bacterium]
VQNKVLEAMASGLPVVGTSIAFQSLAAGPDEGIRAADTPDGLAGEVVTLLGSSERRQELGRRARSYVERHHRWEDVGAMLESTLLAATARHEAAGRRVSSR